MLKKFEFPEEIRNETRMMHNQMMDRKEKQRDLSKEYEKAMNKLKMESDFIKDKASVLIRTKLPEINNTDLYMGHQINLKDQTVTAFDEEGMKELDKNKEDPLKKAFGKLLGGLFD